jgi:signal peptidase I
LLINCSLNCPGGNALNKASSDTFWHLSLSLIQCYSRESRYSEVRRIKFLVFSGRKRKVCELNNLKPKEPLLAVMFGVMVTGLGQIYAGKIKRGILFFSIPAISAILLVQYLLNPNTTTNPLLLVLVIIAVAYSIFVIVDAYRCAKAYNTNNNLASSITSNKNILFIAGIIIFAFILNPSSIVARGVAFYIRSNIAQAFKMPTETMEPTLLKGDLILADKAIYKKSEPKRGDLIIFIYPPDTRKMFIKRLVGLPGETIEIKSGSILINGTVLSEPRFANKHYYNKGDYAKEGQAVKIPDDGYFVLGDNTAASLDSRYWGFVPKRYLTAKVYKIYYPFDRSGPVK